jgi:spore coat polysaccharide biosynthesis protein SpsF
VRAVIIVQARMGSTRLPGKVMKPILGKSMLEHQLERLDRCTKAEAIVIATTEGSGELPIVELVESLPSFGLFRGAEDDVLARYYGAAKQFEADAIVRITSDCPLIEPTVVDRCIETFVRSRETVDYVSNCQRRTYPRGLDAEVFSFAALETAYMEASATPDREHVTPFIRRQPKRFGMVDVVDAEDHSDLRWTVDTPEDFELVTRIYEALYPSNPAFAYGDVLELVRQNPSLSEINRHIEQKQYGQ